MSVQEWHVKDWRFLSIRCIFIAICSIVSFRKCFFVNLFHCLFQKVLLCYPLFLMILKSLNTCCYKKWEQYSLYSKETLVRKVIYVKNNFVYDDFLFFKENEYSCRCTYVLSFWNIVYYSKSRIPLLPTKSGFIILYFLLSHKLRSLNHSVRSPSQSFGEDAPACYWFRRMKNMVSGLFWSSKKYSRIGLARGVQPTLSNHLFTTKKQQLHYHSLTLTCIPLWAIILCI